MKTSFICAFTLCCVVGQVFASSLTRGLPCLRPERDPTTGFLVNCGRGGRRCSLGYRCNIHPADRYAVCCPKKTVTPGFCPALNVGIPGPCVERCSRDDDCPGPQKCCSNGCGHVCKLSVKKREKIGFCPPVRPGTIGICVERCSNDFSCHGIQKCCSNGCGHVCRAPIYYPRPNSIKYPGK